MNPLQVLCEIRHAGGTVVVEGDRLRINAPPGLLTIEHKAVLAEHKTELLRVLAPAIQVDLERVAIQWVESLDLATAAAVVETAVREWTEHVQGVPAPGRPAIPPL